MIANFNINDYVWVKLTPYGKDALRKKHEELFSKTYPYVPPKEDSDGWSRWQMWDLMSQLGSTIWHGGKEPFHTQIRVEIKEPESA